MLASILLHARYERVDLCLHGHFGRNQIAHSPAPGSKCRWVDDLITALN
jgi:hypothetical protein